MIGQDPSGGRRPPGPAFTPVEREKAAVKALGMIARGARYKDVAAELGVSRKTVTKLVKDAPEYLGISPEQKDLLRAQIIARLADVQKRCYDALEAKHERDRGSFRRGEAMIQPQSFNLVAILQTLMAADDRLVKLLGLAEPEKATLNLTTAADRIKAYRDRVAARRAFFEALEGGKDGGRTGEERPR